MTAAVFAASLAGVLAAAGIVELAGELAAARAASAEASPTASGSPSGSGRRRLAAVLVRLGRRLGVPAPPRELAVRLDAAGAPLGLADLMALKGGAALAGLVAGAPLASALPGRLPLPGMLAAPVAGFLAPDLWLLVRARARGKAMAVELPDLLDLLRVCVQAGLPLARGLGEAGRRHRGPLAAEWRRTAGELELGVPRSEALLGLARRCPPPEIAALVATIERAERHGSPLAATLAAQAREARAARARQVRDQAARAAPKIQLVVALLLVPSVLLLVAAALTASLLGA